MMEQIFIKRANTIKTYLQEEFQADEFKLSLSRNNHLCFGFCINGKAMGVFVTRDDFISHPFPQIKAHFCASATYFRKEFI